MNESRRNFIKGIVLSSLAPSLLGASFKQRADTIVLANANGGNFWLFDWNKYHLTEVPVSLGPMHSALQLAPHRVLFLEFWNQNILSYDLKSKKTQKIKLADNQFFNGHGILSPDKKTLLTVQQELTPHSSERTSRIVMRDPVTLKERGVLFTSHTGTFHDLTFMKNQLILSEGNYFGSSDSKVHFFDWDASSSQAKKKHEVSLPGVHAISTHFLALPNDRLLVVPAAQRMLSDEEVKGILKNEKSYQNRLAEIGSMAHYQPTPVFIVEADGSLTKLWSDKDGENFVHNLSPCRIPTPSGELIAVTHVEGRSLSVWKDNQLLKRLTWDEKSRPEGLAYSSQFNELLVVDKGLIRFLSVPDFKEKKVIQLHDGGSAVHLLRLA